MIPSYIDQLLREAAALNRVALSHPCQDMDTSLKATLNDQAAAFRRIFKELEAPAVVAPHSNLGADWTDVAQLPDDYLTVLVCCADGEVDAAFHMDGCWVWLSGHDVEQTVIAWAHMPAGPEAMLAAHNPKTEQKAKS